MSVDAAFGNWLAGFIDGEGCFGMDANQDGRLYCNFNILVRLDDAQIIREIHERLGIGTVYTRRQRSIQGKPQIVWKVRKLTDCQKLATVLDEYPLRAKKRRDYEIWRMALAEQGAHQIVSGVKVWDAASAAADAEYVRTMQLYREELSAIKQYEEEGSTLPEPAPLLRLAGG